MASSARGSQGGRAATDRKSADIDGRLDSSPALDRAIQNRIGDKLRAMYGELADQPVPDRFVSLLNQLGTGKGDPN
jgi:hypothetical protein